MKKILSELNKVSKRVNAEDDVDWDTYDSIELIRGLYDKMADEYEAKKRNVMKLLNSIEYGKSDNRKIKAWLKRESADAKNTGKHISNELDNAESNIK